MRAAWRLRRMAAQGLQIPYPPVRKASSQVSPESAPLDLHVRIPSQSTARTSTKEIFRDSSEPGPSNYAQRISATTAFAKDNSDNTFFTTHRATPLQHALKSTLQTEERSRRLLRKYVNLPAQQRDTALASAVWRHYKRLPFQSRRMFSPTYVQKILRAVVPGPAHFRDLYKGQQQARRDHKAPQGRTPANYFERISTILSDMSSLQAPLTAVKQGWAGATPQDLRFAFTTLSHLGDTVSCELLADQLRAEGRTVDIRMIDARLFALTQSLLARRTKHLQPIKPQKLAEMLWTILGDMSAHNLLPRRITFFLLTRIIPLAKSRVGSNPEAQGELDKVLEDVFTQGYGLDMQYLTFSSPEKKAAFTATTLRALLDLFGKRGEVYRMLSAFEVLQDLDGVIDGSTMEGVNTGYDDIMSDMGSTLSEMTAQEEMSRSRMSFFGPNRNGTAGIDGASFERQSPPHLPPPLVDHTLPTSASKAQPLSSAFSRYLGPFESAWPQSASAPSTTADLAFPHSLISTSTFSTLLYHIREAGDFALYIHILESALLAIPPVRAEWLSAIQARHARTGGDDQHPEWTAIPHPRLAVYNVWFLDAFHEGKKQNASIKSMEKLAALAREGRNIVMHEAEALLAIRPESTSAAVLMATATRLTEVVDLASSWASAKRAKVVRKWERRKAKEAEVEAERVRMVAQAEKDKEERRRRRSASASASRAEVRTEGIGGGLVYAV